MSVPALCVFIVVGRSPMQDSVIVQELNVARLEIHFQAKFFRKLVKEFERFFLLFGQAWGLGESLCCAKVAGRIDAGQAATEIVEKPVVLVSFRSNGEKALVLLCFLSKP